MSYSTSNLLRMQGSSGMPYAPVAPGSQPHYGSSLASHSVTQSLSQFSGAQSCVAPRPVTDCYGRPLVQVHVPGRGVCWVLAQPQPVAPPPPQAPPTPQPMPRASQQKSLIRVPRGLEPFKQVDINALMFKTHVESFSVPFSSTSGPVTLEGRYSKGRYSFCLRGEEKAVELSRAQLDAFSQGKSCDVTHFGKVKPPKRPKSSIAGFINKGVHLGEKKTTVEEAVDHAIDANPFDKKVRDVFCSSTEENEFVVFKSEKPVNELNKKGTQVVASKTQSDTYYVRLRREGGISYIFQLMSGSKGVSLREVEYTTRQIGKGKKESSVTGVFYALREGCDQSFQGDSIEAALSNWSDQYSQAFYRRLPHLQKCQAHTSAFIHRVMGYPAKAHKEGPNSTAVFALDMAGLLGADRHEFFASTEGAEEPAWDRYIVDVVDGSDRELRLTVGSLTVYFSAHRASLPSQKRGQGLQTGYKVSYRFSVGDEATRYRGECEVPRLGPDTPIAILAHIKQAYLGQKVLRPDLFGYSTGHKAVDTEMYEDKTPPPKGSYKDNYGVTWGPDGSLIDDGT